MGTHTNPPEFVLHLNIFCQCFNLFPISLPVNTTPSAAALRLRLDIDPAGDKRASSSTSSSLESSAGEDISDISVGSGASVRLLLAAARPAQK